MFIPAHFERLAVIGVNKIEDGLVVNLDEGNENLICLIRRRSFAYLQEKLTNSLWNDSFHIRIITSFNRIGLPGTCLSVCEDGGVITLNYPIDEADCFDALIDLRLQGFRSENTIELKNLLSLFG